VGAAREVIDRSLFLSPDGITFDGKRAVPNEEVTKLMLELADLQPGEKVLEIGTGSGYQTCCIVPSWMRCGNDRLNRDFTSLMFRPSWKPAFGDAVDGDGARRGILEARHYDCIIVSCGMTSIPPAYEEQLREGGRLIIPLGKPDGQELLRLEKRNGKLVMGELCWVRKISDVPMTNCYGCGGAA
jgi:protein-L-isoaspartate O-methyltransferase